ncbi:MAG: HK97 family phage prohead protease [Candidatus Azobacteroides pseudotrichonymphae]|uniref:HK97 family phage prohead protease n=1 Tax=Candidatus Improbicoccus pseudotrichonymphae TaxID=3033792 RepID=A0AA48IA34_9FIRM|nr:MAG: HK97 family phage prohead protease [Candidatus Improbicoccus pseudotrichonymphae]GMO39310.1 MAG: HK97 family phage prohead protease [Candidatus Azobacteroides pseudotrichonymphae]
MRIEIRNDSITVDGYVNAVARDSSIMLDDNGERFVEQIQPKVFQRAIDRSDNIVCLLNHEDNKFLASTKQGNLELFEDNIGLRAICKISDSEIIEKARNQKLRGWSFGFESLKESEELIKDGPNELKRRFIEDMNLLEVSIIDDRKIPCYVGTSIETRSRDGTKDEINLEKRKVEYRCEYFKPKYFEIVKPTDMSNTTIQAISVFDYTPYEEILNKIQSIKFN